LRKPKDQRLCIALLSTFLATGSVVGAQIIDGRQSAPRAASKVLRFPSDVAYGRVWLCPPDWSAIGDIPSVFGSEDKIYRSIGAAKGDLTVPSNAALRFRPSHELLQDPALLKNVPVDPVAFLDLAGVDVDVKALKLIAGFPNVRRIDLRMADLDDDLLGKLSVTPKLEALFLASTPISGVTLGSLAGLKSLKALSLASVYLKPEAYRQLVLFKNLTKLDLSNTRIQDKDLELFLPKMINLRMLALVGCRKLTPASNKTIACLSKLSLVDIIGTGMTGKDIVQASGGKLKIERILSGPPTSKFSVREADKIFHPLR
jgi:hypothetical protein